MSQPIIDRDTYRSIKKMSREELQAFLVRYADELRKDEPTIDLREVEKDIRAVKGIGEKRAEEIMRIFGRHLGVSNCCTQNKYFAATNESPDSQSK